jgi:50S ribosomal protein L16 3-hydroxylase
MPLHHQALTLLGGLSPAEFIAHYWQKKPLLIKQAIPQFSGLLDPNELAGLACEDEVQSRIVQQDDDTWMLRNGPFSETDFAKLPEKNWTLLVQSVNHFLPEACELLQQFNFIPNARLDDLMVSYAPDGGGVGPHFDSYDVFLLQGQGQRLWRISEQTDLTLVDGAPLRILKHFNIADEWVLEAGDMLYLPPHLAHWGIAKSVGEIDCMTYSIGFRAPKYQELATEFLGFMQDQFTQEKCNMAGIYQDPDLTLQENPAEISMAMVKKVNTHLQKIQWSEETVAEFLGRYLTEPKMDVLFEPNKMHMNLFADQLFKKGIVLDLKSQLLFNGAHFYMNGEQQTLNHDALTRIKKLAYKRTLLATDLQDQETLDHNFLQCLYEWYCAGYCHLN